MAPSNRSSQTPAGKRRVLTPKERRERNRQEVINGILDAAREIMREEGVGALTIQEIARRVGMRAPSLYNYFPSKMAIYETLFARGLREYREGAEALQAQFESISDWQEAAITYSMTFAREHPELYQLLFERPVPGFVPSEEGLEEGRKLLEMGRPFIEQEMAAGRIDPSFSVEQVRDIFVALMHGLTALHMANEPELPVGQGRFGSLIPMAVRAMNLLYKAGNPEQ